MRRRIASPIGLWLLPGAGVTGLSGYEKGVDMVVGGFVRRAGLSMKALAGVMALVLSLGASGLWPRVRRR